MGIENPGILKKRFISKKNEKAGRDFQDKEVLFSQELQTNDNKKTESDEMKLTSVIETLAKEAIEKTSRRKQSLVKNSLFDCKGINVSVDKSKQFTRVTVSKNLGKILC